MRLREGGLGPRTHGALNGGSELCPGIRVWLAETALLGWAGLMDAQRERTPPRRQWVALGGAPAFDNSGIQREVAGCGPGNCRWPQAWL